MFRHFIIASLSLLFLFVAACGGGGEDPILPRDENTTVEIEEADRVLNVAIDKCTGQVVGVIGGGAGPGASQDSFNSQIANPGAAFGGGIPAGANPVYVQTQPCFDELLVALLLWKSAPKKDKTLAWWDQRYQNYVYRKIIFNVDRIGSAVPPALRNQVSDQFIAGYQNYFLPRAAGSLPPNQLGVLTQSATF